MERNDVRQGYQIADEPVTSGMAHLAVRPFWPLLAVMFGGVWLSWSWFAFNGFILGSPSRVRELVTIVFGLVGGVILALLITTLHGNGVLSETALPYATLVLVAWKLLVSYRIYVLQTRMLELYVHFGGTVRNGIGILVVGALITPRLMRLFAEFPFLSMVLR